MSERDEMRDRWPGNVIAFPSAADCATRNSSTAKDARLTQLRQQIQAVEQREGTVAPELLAAIPRSADMNSVKGRFERASNGLVAHKQPPSDSESGNLTALVNQEESSCEQTVTDRIDEAVTMLTRSLARSPKSQHECERLLSEQTELDPAERAEVLQRLLRYGYLDDARFAQQLVDGRLTRKGLSKAAKARELHARGLGHEVIADALEEDQTDDFALALELARKRAGSLRSLDREVAQRRLYGYLGRRGFSAGIVSEVTRLVLQPNASSGPYFR